MKRLLSVLAVVVASVTLTVPAAQAAPHCVTWREYRKVHVPMSVTRVRGIFDTNGSVARKDGPVTVRTYNPCRGLRAVSVTFKNGHMRGKSAIPR